MDRPGGRPPGGPPPGTQGRPFSRPVGLCRRFSIRELARGLRRRALRHSAAAAPASPVLDSAPLWRSRRTKTRYCRPLVPFALGALLSLHLQLYPSSAGPNTCPKSACQMMWQEGQESLEIGRQRVGVRVGVATAPFPGRPIRPRQRSVETLEGGRAADYTPPRARPATLKRRFMSTKLRRTHDTHVLRNRSKMAPALRRN